MSIKSFAFIFDLDGTLVDSFQKVFETLLKTAEMLKIGKFTKSKILELFGLPLKNIISQCDVANHKIDEFIEVFRMNLEKSVLQKNYLFPGVLDCLNIIKTHKFPMVVATSKPSKLARLVIQNSELKDHPLRLVGTDFQPAKPDPYVIKQALKIVNCKQGIMIGDRIEDVQAGISAGILTCGITQTYHSEKDFANVGAHFAYPNMIDLSQFLPGFIENLDY